MKTLLSTVCFAVLCSAAFASPTSSTPTSVSHSGSVGALPEFVVIASRETPSTDERIGQLPELIVVERAPAKARKTAPAATPRATQPTPVTAASATPSSPSDLHRTPVVASNGF